MMSMMRKKREEHRLKMLRRAFEGADANKSGKITKEQFVKIFQTYDAEGERAPICTFS